MTDLTDLIARLEGAEAGSRALDCEIARATGWFRYTRELGCTLRRGGWISPKDFLGTDSAGHPLLDSMHGTEIWPDPPKFSRSLDDALRWVVPEGWKPRVSIDRVYINEDVEPAGHLIAWAAVTRDTPGSSIVRMELDEFEAEVKGGVRALPRALCIAALKAQAAKGEGDG